MNPAVWAEEYRFTDAYNQYNVDVHAYQSALELISNDASYQDKYLNYYSAGNPRISQLIKQNWDAYLCGMKVVERWQYADCHCGSSH